MASVPSQFTSEPEPVWDLATLYPGQGAWDEWDYLELIREGNNRLVELTDGYVEVLPMPTNEHQDILVYLFDALRSYVATGKLGKVQIAGIPIRIRPGKVRQPDIVFLGTTNLAKQGHACWDGADLVIEIVSDDQGSRDRDYRKKPIDYAEGRIPEYWIVDPQDKRITVLTLDEGATGYSEHGVFTPGQLATSKLLVGFAVDVQSVFDAAEGK